MANDPPNIDDAFRRRAKNIIGRSRRQGYRADPIPEGFRFPSVFTGGIDQSDESGSAEGFSGLRASAIVGITHRQLDYWMRSELARPSVQVTDATGTRWRFSYEDLVGLKVLKRLLDAGVSLQQARRALTVLRQSAGSLDDANLVLGPVDGPRLVRSGEEIVELLKGGRGVLNIVPLEGVFEELNAAIASMPRGESPSGTTAAIGTDETRAGTA